MTSRGPYWQRMFLIAELLCHTSLLDSENHSPKLCSMETCGVFTQSKAAHQGTSNLSKAGDETSIPRYRCCDMMQRTRHQKCLDRLLKQIRTQFLSMNSCIKRIKRKPCCRRCNCRGYVCLLLQPYCFLKSC